jgi:hypothetical protein
MTSNIRKNRRGDAECRIERLRSGLTTQIKIVPQGLGETQPISRDPATNRRVEVFFPAQITPPLCICTCRGFFTQYDLRFLPRDGEFGIEANRNMTRQEKIDRTSDVDAMV